MGGTRRPERWYRIRVEGDIDPSWSARLAGMTVHREAESGEPRPTSLEGVLPDRAALLGVIATLNDLNVTIISVDTDELDRDQEATEV